jgi:DNA adenine methylase
MMATKTPLKSHGGKYYLAQRVLELMPQHLNYVEPFFGAGQVLFARDPADRRLWWPGRTSDGREVDGVSELANDLDGNLMNFYAVLKDPEAFTRLRHRLDLTLFSEAEWQSACALLAGSEGDEVERAAALFVAVRQSRQALRKDFATPVQTRLRGGRQEHVNAWWGAIAGLEEFHRRIQNVLILCRPAVEVILQQDAPSTLFYCDPPYVPGTRTARKAYGAFEMTEEGHRELLDVLRRCQGKVMLSGYSSGLYDEALADWTRHTFDLPNNASGTKAKQQKTEVLWCNF